MASDLLGGLGSDALQPFTLHPLRALEKHLRNQYFRVSGAISAENWTAT